MITIYVWKYYPTKLLRFHAIYWPAFLLALDIPPPKKFVAHGHWTLGREKMSKSTGNVVNPFFAMDRFGVDTMRFYFAHDGSIDSDADYGNSRILERYKTALQGGFGNLTSRIMRGKGWNVRKAVEKGTTGHLGLESTALAAQYKKILELPGRVDSMMEDAMIKAATETITNHIYDVSDLK